MSFLQQLQQRREQLQKTTTIVTTATGERFIESGTLAQPPIKLESNSFGFVVDTKPDTIPACILDDLLYLGSQDAVCVENVHNYKLTHILSVGIEMPYLECQLEQKFLPCLDLPETRLFDGIVQDAFEFIENARLSKGRVLVHCNAGVSRSASIVIAYLMLLHKYNFETAYALVKSKRECIQPNVGFLNQLKNYK